MLFATSLPASRGVVQFSQFMNYKEAVYSHYRSAFKGSSDAKSQRFAADKVRPLLAPWVKLVDKSAKCADLGCGAGELLLALKDLGFTKLSGCDFSAEQVAIAQMNFQEVVRADLFEFLSRSEENSFGLITVFDVIEHLGPQQTFDLLAMIHRKLAPRGLLIAHVPNGLSPFVGSVFWGDLTHAWCLTPESARTLCQLQGFTAYEAVEHVGAGPGIKGRLRELAWRCLKFALRAMNLIETGQTGGPIWTRNFAFKAAKSDDV